MRVLAGDIGGTNARLAIIDIDEQNLRIVFQKRLTSRDFSGLVPLVRSFFRDAPEVPSSACFGIACPMVDGTCTATNHPWTIETASLPAQIEIPRTVVIVR